MNELPAPPLVFLADDDTAMRSLLRTLLARRGFEVIACPDGTALVGEIVRAQAFGPRPQVIVSDVQMVGTSGLDVVEAAQRLLPEVPVILITAFGDERTHRRARALGALAVVNKPFAVDELLRLIATAVTAHGA